MYVCDSDGNAAAKSKNIIAPVDDVRAVFMAAYSMSRIFFKIDLCRKNPCCWGLTHGLRILSQRSLAAFAMSVLSVLTMLSGRVLLASYTSPCCGSCRDGFFPKHIRSPKLNSCPSGVVSTACIVSRSIEASSDCNASAASNKTWMAWFPDSFQAVYGMPSGPGAELPASFTAFLISLIPIRHSCSSEGSGGLVLELLGVSFSDATCPFGLLLEDDEDAVDAWLCGTCSEPLRDDFPFPCRWQAHHVVSAKHMGHIAEVVVA